MEVLSIHMLFLFDEKRTQAETTYSLDWTILIKKLF